MKPLYSDVRWIYNLDAISRRVRTLAADQQQLNEKQEQAKRLREDMAKTGNG